MRTSLMLSLLFVAMLSFSAGNHVLQTGKVRIEWKRQGKQYATHLTYDGTDIPFITEGQPTCLEVDGIPCSAPYSSVKEEGGAVLCTCRIRTTAGSVLMVQDTYSKGGQNRFSVKREVVVSKVKNQDNSFLSSFGIKTPGSKQLTDNDYFIPGVWYKGNFDADCHLPGNNPQATDAWHLYRDDRTPLPLVMSRDKSTGITICLALADTPSRTVMADVEGDSCNAGYQFGSCGIWRDTLRQANCQLVCFPGSTKGTRGGSGHRCHPLQKGVRHEYSILLSVNKTSDYAQAVRESWNEVLDAYNPQIYQVDQDSCYEGLMQTLLTYYVPGRKDGGQYDEPGFPFEVSLTDFKPRGIDYQSGFVGMQVEAGYCLMRYGLEHRDATIRHKGEAVLDFWSEKSLEDNGLPRTWYDPSRTDTGTWRHYESILRIMAGGFHSLLDAWRYADGQGISHPNWLQSCREFGNFLLRNQHDDGSFSFSWKFWERDGYVHPVLNDNRLTTPSVISYLKEMYQATADERYREAALKAGEFCYRDIHLSYHYCACVVDNPQVIDSESGLMAMEAFEALYMLDREPRWLQAWRQAADYYVTWVYCHEIPVEDDRPQEDCCDFPRDRSIVGQHLIAIGHAGADLGFAWGSYNLFHLWQVSRDRRYLRMARISAHDTKQSMNWDQSLYPGQPRGLQLEAFHVMIPRRVKGINTTLNWNYAAHLHPMLRFKDNCGTPDIESAYRSTQVER